MLRRPSGKVKQLTGIQETKSVVAASSAISHVTDT
jgi:hypothetical protein